MSSIDYKVEGLEFKHACVVVSVRSSNSPSSGLFSSAAALGCMSSENIPVCRIQTDGPKVTFC